MTTSQMYRHSFLLGLCVSGVLAACSSGKSAATNSAEPMAGGPLSGRITL